MNSLLASAVLNSKDYGIAQNRERLWMFAQLGGLPKDFSITPPKIESEMRLVDFLDPNGYVPEAMYLSEAQIAHLKVKHNIPSFKVDTPLCLDIYNKKIKYDGYSITITQPEHNSLPCNRSTQRQGSCKENVCHRAISPYGFRGIARSWSQG